MYTVHAVTIYWLFFFFNDPSLLFFVPQSANQNTEYATWELTAAVSVGRLINKS